MIKKIINKLKIYFITGSLVIIPLIGTMLIVMIIFRLLRRIFSLPAFWLKEVAPFEFLLPIIGFILAIIIIIFMGFLVTNALGKAIHRYLENLLQRMPIIRIFYTGIKQILELLFFAKSKFVRPVLVQFPREGAYSIGFITAQQNELLKNKIGEEAVNVYVPTALNLASGFLIMLPAKDVLPLNVKVEDAFKMVVSGGVVNIRDVIEQERS